MSEDQDNSEDLAVATNQAQTDPELLARVFIRTNGLMLGATLWLVYWRGEFWRWVKRHYVRLPDHELKAQLTWCLQQHFAKLPVPEVEPGKKPIRAPKVTRGLVGNVIQNLQGITFVADAFEVPGWLPGAKKSGTYLVFSNGMVSLDDLLAGTPTTVTLHSPYWFSIVGLDYAFDPTAECPQWIAFLDWALEGDAKRIELVQEWFGYLLTLDTSQQRLLILVGDGANGKSVVLAVLTAMLGPGNISNVPLELFSDKFQLIRTVGKLANIAGDVGPLDQAAEGTVKSFVGGDRMSFDRKFLPAIDAIPTARLVFSMNELPSVTDRSEGLWRRLCVVPFRVSVPPKQRDRKLAEKLTAELPGILNWALVGLRRLREVGHFTEPALSVAVQQEHRASSDPVRRILAESFVADAGQAVRCSAVQDVVRRTLRAESESQASHKAVGAAVRREFPNVDRQRRPVDGQREWFYVGIAWREQSPPPDLSHMSQDSVLSDEFEEVRG